jgi:hypothetical protein
MFRSYYPFESSAFAKCLHEHTIFSELGTFLDKSRDFRHPFLLLMVSVTQLFSLGQFPL